MQTLKAYLETVAKTQLRGEYVAPSDDVAKKIEFEVRAQYQLLPASLSIEEMTGKSKRISPIFVTAIPERFADDAVDKIGALAAHLVEKKAKRFEVVFANRVIDDNLWGDKILLAARYSET